MMRLYPATRIMRLLALVLIALLAAGLVHYALRDPVPAVDAANRDDLAILGGDPGGFQRVTGPRNFDFPRDHGPHPDYRNEWWYFTGNLDSGDGRRFGFELTFFRNALTPEPLRRESAWASEQIYMAHFALTDIDGNRFHAFERYHRAALGLAGAKSVPFRVWLRDWEVAGGDPFPIRLRAAEADISLELTLNPQKPLVLQGDRGYSRKSDDPGNASHYYSYTRLGAEGLLRVGSKQWPVSGLAWLDREWSTSALGENQAGWDWFALQLDDGTDLMFYHLRLRDGSADPHSSGVIVNADGNSRRLEADSIAIDVLGHWQSPATKARYPSGWRLRGDQLALEITPLVKNQELDLSFRYWEGAVAIRGEHRGRQVGGRGYVELTGY